MTSSRVLWATDIHLDAAELPVVEAFCAGVNAQAAEALMLGGDIAAGPTLVEWLTFLADRVHVPIYFVLGNHDYYGSSIADVRRRMQELDDPRLRWLPHAGVVDLGGGVKLVGHDGWGDARLGNFFRSPVVFTDYLAIRELASVFDLDSLDGDLSKQGKLKQVLGDLGDDAANALRPVLHQAVRDSSQVIVLTHVPPFREACWYGGEISNDDWLPGMTCKAMGDLLLETAEANPGCRVTVLCGHTHGTGIADIRPNLRVHTGEARYGSAKFRAVKVREGDVVVGEVVG